jgi:rod shape-determining protein MreD
MIDLIDQRVVFRDFWQDWLIAGGSICFCLILGRLVASPLAAHVDTLLMLQIAVTTLLFPLATRICTMLTREEETV